MPNRPSRPMSWCYDIRKGGSVPNELHVIFGGGQVGQPLARILRERGLRVRMARRSAGAPDGVELMRGDATDHSFCLDAARGASTIYHCMNPPYSAQVWADLIPKYIENGSGANGSVMKDHGRMHRFVSVEALFHGRHFHRQIIIVC